MLRTRCAALPPAIASIDPDAAKGEWLCLVATNLVSRLPGKLPIFVGTVSLELRVVRAPERVQEQLGLQFKPNKGAFLEAAAVRKVLQRVQEDKRSSVHRAPKVRAAELTVHAAEVRLLVQSPK